MIMLACIDIRPLTPTDITAYRALRQKIMESGEGKLFGSSFIRERKFTDDEWRDWLIETQKHCIFGTFVDAKLIGIMRIVGCKTVPHVAEWDDTWLDPKYRKSGIARMAYEKVFHWTKRHKYDFAVVIIRKDNLRSIEIRQKQGFSYVSTKQNNIWADGSRADSMSFMLNLRDEMIANENEFDRVKDAVEFFNTAYEKIKLEEQFSSVPNSHIFCLHENPCSKDAGNHALHIGML